MYLLVTQYVWVHIVLFSEGSNKASVTMTKYVKLLEISLKQYPVQ